MHSYADVNEALRQKRRILTRRIPNVESLQSKNNVVSSRTTNVELCRNYVELQSNYSCFFQTQMIVMILPLTTPNNPFPT